MKTPEEHLYDTFNDGTGEPQTLEDFVSKLKAHPYHAPLIKAMQLYSDQQNKEKDLDLIAANQYVSELRKENKELREKVKMWEETADRSFRSYVEENQRLTTENKELRETIDSILNKSESDQDVIIIERGFHIQRLTKENKEKEAEIQRLRELLENATEPAKILLKLVKDWDLLIDNKKDVDEFRVIAEIKRAEKLLTEIDNALNPKP